jgi:hypothetical protein
VFLHKVTFPEDVVRWEANHVYSERLWGWRQKRQDWSAARVVARSRGKQTPSEPESSGGDDEVEDEDGEVGEVTPPPHYPLPEDLPSLGDIFSQQVGIFIDARLPTWPQMETGLLTGPLP